MLSFTLLAACGKKVDPVEEDPVVVDPVVVDPVEVDPVEVDPVEDVPEMDLGGMEIVIGDWWSPQEAPEPSNAYQEATQEYREMIQEKYNFTMKQVAVAEWGGMQELFTTSTVADDPAADIFLLAPGWATAPIANGLVYDLATLDSLDFTESKWISNVKDATSQGGSIYGMNAGTPEPRLGVFWNKRLFQEANLDPDLPYDLQASGDWTWEEFEKICVKLTQDTNNDGETDKYAMVSFSNDLFRGVLTSNDARHIGKDASGKYYNGSTEPNFLEAIQWAISLIEKGYEMPAAEGAEWDWFGPAFTDGKVAMRVAEEYVSDQQLASMEDDFGFVLFPKGPKSGNKYSAYFSDNVAVIPSSYDKETAEKIAFAYNLWTEPTPGYEDEDTWQDFYYPRYRDERAVDETLTIMLNDAVENNDYFAYISGLDVGATFTWDVYALAATPAEKIEEMTSAWQALIDDANK
jgi:ABC-type glycerol-3-phosphate transport system substrate-binding protein